MQRTNKRKSKKRNVIIGFSLEDYARLKEACELTFRSKTLFIKKLVLPEVEKILKEKRGKHGTRTN